ncbi:MAG: helix-turn-helix domain-containing protein [Oscillospiraceae bacterium]|nr:helix-turn-helix domain-containing protein [Oscillospiraceae bacterium]
MYTAQTTKERIKKLCKNKKINMEHMLKECNLGVNAIRQINDNKGMASYSLAKIADYLDCSVDYLLGRTDDPDLHKK